MGSLSTDDIESFDPAVRNFPITSTKSFFNFNLSDPPQLHSTNPPLLPRRPPPRTAPLINPDSSNSSVPLPLSRRCPSLPARPLLRPSPRTLLGNMGFQRAHSP